MKNDIAAEITAYFKDRIKEFGPTPAGVDWNSTAAQETRFKALCTLIRGKDKFSLNDLGCGYGQLADYVSRSLPGCSYLGYDLSQEMIDSAMECVYSLPEVSFFQINSPSEMKLSDFTVASGIFNVKMDRSESQWLSYVLETIEQMDKKSTSGFAFNMLTKYSDAEYMQDRLYYADPCFFFDYCKRNYSRNVALIHDYNLYDFTVRVIKDTPGV